MPLPTWLDSAMLTVLEDVNKVSDRKRVLQQLIAATAPLNLDQVRAIAEQDDDDEEDDAEPPPKSAPKPPPRPAPETQETDPARAAASAAVRDAVGHLSPSEHKRLEAVIIDLTNKSNMLKTALTGRDAEIERLESENKTLKGTDVATLTAGKHLDALIALLKKQSREAQEIAIERLCNALGIDPHKLNIEKEAA
jgi:hypothetical protein